MPILKRFKLLLALGFHSEQNSSHLARLPLPLQLLKQTPQTLLKLLCSFAPIDHEIPPIVRLIVVLVLPIAVTVGVDDVSPLKLEQETLVLREEHLSVDIVHLVALDEANDVQVHVQLAFAALVEHGMLLSE